MPTPATDSLRCVADLTRSKLESVLAFGIGECSELGDAHALDADTAVGALLRDALVAVTGQDDERRAFALMGVQLDQVVTSALAFGLPGRPGSICDAALRTGQPLRVTWRMFERGFGLDVDELLERASPVNVCENPGVVTLAADRLQGSCAPLICTEGMPASVTAALLHDLTDAGVPLRVHSDFDLGGVAIMSHVIERFGAEPWAMSADDYRSALDGPTGELVHEIGATPWDRGLAEVMNEHRRSVHEEAVASVLLDDLRTWA